MKLTMAAAAACVAMALGQSASSAVVVNRDGAKWEHEKRDPPGAFGAARIVSRFSRIRLRSKSLAWGVLFAL